MTISGFTAETDGRILLSAADDGFIENLTLRDFTLDYAWIEDPTPIAAEARSSQFPSKEKHPDLLAAPAAIVAENLTNLRLENFQVFWPETEQVPEEWQYPERIENGSMTVHRYDYNKAKQIELGVLWGKGLTGGYINNFGQRSSDLSVAKYQLQNSSIAVLDKK